MKKSLAFAILAVIFLLPMATASRGADQGTRPRQSVEHSFLCSDIGAKCVFKISGAGEIEWEYPVDQCTDAWMLDNGNVLMSFTGKKRGVREVTPDKEVAWEYSTRQRSLGLPEAARRKHAGRGVHGETFARGRSRGRDRQDRAG